MMTWNVQYQNGIGSTRLTVDGAAVSKIYGPYSASVGVNYSSIYGNLSVGTHTYAITATDGAGNSSQYTGTFDVATSEAPIIGNVVVVTGQSLMTWNVQYQSGIGSTRLTVDGAAVSKINGPYGHPPA